MAKAWEGPVAKAWEGLVAKACERPGVKAWAWAKRRSWSKWKSWASSGLVAKAGFVAKLGACGFSLVLFVFFEGAANSPNHLQPVLCFLFWAFWRLKLRRLLLWCLWLCFR